MDSMTKEQVQEMVVQFTAMKSRLEVLDSEEARSAERNMRRKQFSVSLRTLFHWKEKRAREGGSFREHLDVMRQWFLGNPVEGEQEKKLELISSILGRAAERLKPVDDQSTSRSIW